MLNPQQKQTLRVNIVNKAASHLGHCENPLYSNRDGGGVIDMANEFVGNAPPSEPPWCMAFGAYMVAMSAEEMGLSLEDTLLSKTGYCPDEYEHAKTQNTALDPAQVVAGNEAVEAGDLVLFFYDTEDGGTLPHHCEIVTVPPSQGKPAFTSIGGNTVPEGYNGNESEGFGVFRKEHSALEKNASGHNHFVFLRTV